MKKKKRKNIIKYPYIYLLINFDKFGRKRCLKKSKFRSKWCYPTVQYLD